MNAIDPHLSENLGDPVPEIEVVLPEGLRKAREGLQNASKKPWYTEVGAKGFYIPKKVLEMGSAR